MKSELQTEGVLLKSINTENSDYDAFSVIKVLRSILLLVEKSARIYVPILFDVAREFDWRCMGNFILSCYRILVQK